MRRFPVAILGCLALSAALAAVWTSCQRGSRPDDFEWMAIDENYTPKGFVEEFIKTEAEQKGILPVYIRNYDKDASILKRFRGTNFAQPTEASLNMMFPGLDGWMLVGIKYQNEKKQEVLRTVLYVEIGGKWRVGDSGTLLK